MIHRLLITAFLLTLSLFFWGCPAAKESVKETAVRTPDITITAASLNLAAYNKRMDRKDIAALARTLKAEQIDVLTVQSITRYPGLESRADFVKELASIADLRQVFGEMVNSGGKQTGNALFTSFPMRTHTNVSFGPVKSAAFEAGIVAAVDAGVRDVWFASALLPSRASADDAAACMRLLSGQVPDDGAPPALLTGNLPAAPADGNYAEFRVPVSKSQTARFWYRRNAGLEITGSRSVETEFGPVAIVQLGLFRQRPAGAIH